MLDIEGAKADFEKAMRLNPQLKDTFVEKDRQATKRLSPEAHFSNALLKMSIEDYSAAIQDLNKVVAKAPEFKEAYYNRGIARMKTGGYTKAVSDFDEALKIDEEYKEAISQRAIAKTHIADYKGAISRLHASISTQSH